MEGIDLSVTINATLIIYLVTFLLVNGFLIYLLFTLRKTLQRISTYEKDVGTAHFGLNEVSEIDELKQTLFDIQSTSARQLSEITKLKQFLSGTPMAPGANSGSGSTGVRIARSG